MSIYICPECGKKIYSESEHDCPTPSIYMGVSGAGRVWLIEQELLNMHKSVTTMAEHELNEFPSGE